MDKFQNIEQTKEYKMAKMLEMELNSCSFNPKIFAASIPMMHPTNQQSLYRLISECLRIMANENRYYDGRNMASHNEAKEIIEYLRDNEHSIPMR